MTLVAGSLTYCMPMIYLVVGTETICQSCADGKASMAHSFMPGAPDKAVAPASLPPSIHVPDANPRAAAEHETSSSHGFLPEAGPVKEQSLRQRHASISPQGSGEVPTQAKADFVALSQNRLASGIP